MRILITLLSSLLLISVVRAEADRIYLARDGQTEYTIIAADDETKVEATHQTASGELQIYLEEITGAKFPIVRESAFDGKGPGIYVGTTKFALSSGFDVKSFVPEEWAYKTVGKNLLFVGGANNGTLLGVCRFLERELGCHWFTFESSVVPKQKSLELLKWNQRGKPAFVLRSIYLPSDSFGLTKEYYANFLKYAKRNRSNYFDPVWRSTRLTSTCHTFYEYVSWEKYFKTHPEYFTMNEKGERIHGPSSNSHGQLCLSNPEVAQVMLEKLRELIKKDRSTLPRERWPLLYDISQCDNFPYICKCPNCKKITEREGSESALTLTCINRVAREIRKEYPDVVIQTFAYVSTETAPKTIRPEPNVLIRWCDLYSRSDCYRPITSRFNVERRNQLEGWKAIGANIALWDYWNMGILQGPYFKPPRVETIVDAIPGDIRFYRAAGVKSFFTESETNLYVHPQNFIDLHIWLGYQLLDDPDQDEEKLIDTYMRGHYGPAAEPMIAFLTELRRQVANVEHPMIYVSFVGNKRPYQTPEFFERILGYLRNALQLAPEGTLWRLRVEKELITPLAVLIDQPSLIPVKGERKTKRELIAEYEQLRIRQVEAWCNSRDGQKFKEAIAEDLNRLKYELPTPERFKDIPPGKILKFGWPTFKTWQDDPDSATGRATVSPEDKAQYHDATKKGHGGIYPTSFVVLDKETQKGKTIPQSIANDGKYHWYDLGWHEIGRETVVYGFCYSLMADLRDAWTNADGLPDYNRWKIHVSAKFTGPAYVPGSKEKNGVSIDQIVLTK